MTLSGTNHKKPVCAVHSLSSKGCAGESLEVVLLSPADSAEPGLFPHSLHLCQYHKQMELMVWGIKKFFEVYPLLNTGESGDGSKSRWQAELEPFKEDSRLCFSLPDQLEFWLNRLTGDYGDGQTRPEFEHLKEASIDLGEARLTDKQLIAVCMVFYGGVKKKRAAQAMNITSQALSDHIKAALKKIENNLASF